MAHNSYEINEQNEIKKFEKKMQISILTSRFNNSNLITNKIFRSENNIKCIYGSPVEISKSIELNKKCFVLEMNNDTNKIVGIGLIKNYPHYNKYKIYKNSNDRYIYKSDKWLDILNINTNIESTIKNKDEILLMINVLENLCFYGNEHLKRGFGLKKFPIKYLYRLEDELNILKILTYLFEI
jgi:hypothetical protein